MPRLRQPHASYIHHKQSGRGRAIWYDSAGVRLQKLLPGAFGSQESLAAKARLELELAVTPGRSLAEPCVTVAELLVAYLDFAERYYIDADGKPTKEQSVLKYAMRPLRQHYAHLPAAGFGPLALKAVRQHMIDAGLSRALINRRIGALKRIFKWGVAEELIPPGVHEALRALPGLRQGRTAAREAEPVGPVDDAVVDATLPHLPRHVRAIVEIMRHTGMRPSEVCAMTPERIERGETWIYRPTRHKTAHRGKGRAVPLGPNARAILAVFLDGPELHQGETIFSPRRARDERFAEMRASRKSRVQPSQMSRSKASPSRMPSERYNPGAVSHAVAVACAKAFPPPAPLARNRGETAAEWKVRLTGDDLLRLAEWRRLHSWHPYQLRHAFATKVRKLHGLEAAQVLLGHSRADVTQLYAERDEELAAAVAAKVG